MYRAVICLISVACLTSCAPAVKFSGDGFHHEKNKYSIRFTDPQDQRFIDKNWDVDNFACNRYNDTQPCRFERKRGQAYYGRIYMDRNNDGTLEQGRGYFSDLVLRHRITDGRLWISTRDLPEKHSENKLDVFLDNYIESLAGTSRVLMGDALGYYSVETRKYATMVSERQSCGFGPYEAVMATVGIADLDQLRLDENHRVGKLRLLIVKIDGMVDQWISTKRNQWDVTKEGMSPGKIVMITGYYNTPPYFDNDLKDFYAFLKQFVFDNAQDRRDMGRCVDLFTGQPKISPAAETPATMKKSPFGTRESKPKATQRPPTAAKRQTKPLRVELPAD
jgi:hypothetical protein